MQHCNQLCSTESKTFYGSAHAAGAMATAGTSICLSSAVGHACILTHGMTEAFLIGSMITAFAVPLILAIGITHYLGGDKTAILVGSLVGIATMNVIPTITLIPSLTIAGGHCSFSRDL